MSATGRLCHLILGLIVLVLCPGSHHCSPKHIIKRINSWHPSIEVPRVRYHFIHSKNVSSVPHVGSSEQKSFDFHFSCLTISPNSVESGPFCRKRSAKVCRRIAQSKGRPKILGSLSPVDGLCPVWTGGNQRDRYPEFFFQEADICG